MEGRAWCPRRGGRRGGEGLDPSLGRADLHDGGKEVGIDDDTQGQRDHDDVEARDEVHRVVQGRVCTGQLQDGRDLTEAVVHLIGAAVGQVHGKEGVAQAAHHAAGHTDAHHEEARAAAHDDLVPERAADGRVPVHRRDGEEPGLSGPEEEEDVLLSHTPGRGEGPLLAEDMHKPWGTAAVM